MPEKRATQLMKQVMFSCTLPAISSTRKQSRIARENERKKSLQKGKDRYNIVKGLAEGVDGISFESLLKRRHYLRARNSFLILEPYDDSEDYKKESTFLPLQDMWFEGYFAFESLLDPAHFIRRRGEQLILQKYENWHFFKEDCSFRLTRKRCIACIKLGSRVWARVEKGCFLRGVVTAIDDGIHVKLENGKKVHHKKGQLECIAADAIPHVLEVEIGTRVLAKWGNRLDTYYPGTVIAIRQNYFDVRFDDGDKGSNELRELKILTQMDIDECNEVGKSIPSWSSLDGIPRIGGLCIEYGDSVPTSPRMYNQKMNDKNDKNTAQHGVNSTRDFPLEHVSSPMEHVKVAELLDSDTLNENLVHQMANHNCHEEHNQNGDGEFGFENHFQYLSPDLCGTGRNPSQVSGSSSDSGYHGNNHIRLRKTGLWTVTHSHHNVSHCGVKPQFLSPLSYLSHLHVPGLSDIPDVERNLSKLSVCSSLDSGFQGSGHSFRLRDRSPLTVRCPGRAVPVQKREDKPWESIEPKAGEEHEPGIDEKESTEELNGERSKSPLGMETII